MDSRNLELPGEDDYGDEPSGRPPARRRWPWVVGAIALVAAVGAGGIAVAGNFGSAGPATPSAATAPVTARTGTPSAAPSPSPVPAASESSAPVAPSPSATTPPPPTSWLTFTSSDGRVSFEYPAAWHPVESPMGNPGYEGTGVAVSDETGMVVASLQAGPSGGLGGGCEGPVPVTVLDSVNVDIPYQPTKGTVAPRFTFTALQEADHVTASYGLTSFPPGQNGTSCMFYNMVNGPAWSPLFSFADAFEIRAGGMEKIPNRKGAKTFPSMDAARAYMQTAEYLNAKRMITSVKVSAG